MLGGNHRLRARSEVRPHRLRRHMQGFLARVPVERGTQPSGETAPICIQPGLSRTGIRTVVETTRIPSVYQHFERRGEKWAFGYATAARRLCRRARLPHSCCGGGRISTAQSRQHRRHGLTVHLGVMYVSTAIQPVDRTTTRTGCALGQCL